MVRIMLMFYINHERFFNQPDADLRIILEDVVEVFPDESESQQEACL